MSSGGRSLSLRTRVLAGLGLVAVVLVVLAAALTSEMRRQLVDQVDAQLSAAASTDRTTSFDDDRRDRDDDRPPAPTEPGRPGPERLSSLYEAAFLADGTTLVFYESNLPGTDYSDPALDLDIVAAHRDEAFTVSSTAGEVRYRVLATATDDGYFVRALPLRDVDATIDRLTLYEVIGVLAVLGVLGAVGWWVIRLGIRPINAMTRTAEEITEGDLSLRLDEPADGTESGRLARTLNTMLGRIQTAVDDQARSEERLRRFVADASHELRTPVTTIRGYAELYERGGLDQADELDDAMRRTRLEAERMGRLVEDMITLAKLDAERPDRDEAVDVTGVLGDAVRDGRTTAPEHRFVDEVDADLVVVGDEDRLRQAVANVVGNAVVHSGPGTTITVGGRRDGDRVIIEIADDGPGMDAETASRVTERFYRADPSRSRARGGSGLGLSIAAGIVGTHDGRLVVSSEPGQGTTITISLPAGAHP